MKKTLITILLAVIMSVGVFTSTGNNIYAASNDDVYIDNGYGYFWTSYNDVNYITYEYTYYVGDVLYSELDKVKTTQSVCSLDEENYQYYFLIDEKTLSYKIWNMQLYSEEIVYPEEIEYTYSENTTIDNVELRLKTIFINDDSLIKRLLYSEILGNHYQFILNFNAVDESGLDIPMDSIYSLSVKYDLLTTTLGVKTSKEVVKEIYATEEGDILDVWPDYYASIKTYNIDWQNLITESSYDGFDWQVTICEVAEVWGQDKTLDQTQVLTISYYYNDVFYENTTVEHEPIPEEEIIEEGTSLENIMDLFTETKNILTLILFVGGFIVLIITLMYINNFIKGLWYVIKFVFWKIPKFILYQLPKGIWAVLKFLFIPRKKRKEQKRYVGRYI